MRNEPQSADRFCGVSFARHITCRVVILFLLFSVAGLSALAKDSIYLPRRDSAHYINIANKMNVAQSQVVVQLQRSQRPSVIVQPSRPPRVLHLGQTEVPAITPGVSFCLRHRSPPPLLS